MKVLCIRLPAPVEGMQLDSSPWITVDREYTVLGALAEFGGRVQLHLLNPQEWLAEGFWEHYYDGDPAAQESVERELAIIRGEAAG